MTSQPKIRIRNLHKAFGSNKVLRGLDLDIETGESVVVIGGSGSGKSVLLKCILGLVTPDQGSIQIDGVEVVHISERAREEILRQFGMLFQGGALFDSLSVWENVAFGLIQAHGVPRKKAKQIALEKLATVGLEARVAELSPAELSGGMRKRVGLARAIATNPKVIFFDEPTTGLDPIMGSIIDRLIVHSVKELQVTALSITHDMASARRIADRVTMLYEGKLIWDGSVTEIDNSNNPYVDQFIHGNAEGPIQMQVRKP
ncbi:ABC transporter ATP-binding protein [Rhodospirillaceae bacterium AH-315-P19]|nr:ABC transporter ATP-binding protein [Rhodospirillaceae bacterium AH-315-P19]